MTVGIIFVHLSEEAQPCLSQKESNGPGDLVKSVVAIRGSCLQTATDAQADSGLGVS